MLQLVAYIELPHKLSFEKKDFTSSKHLKFSEKDMIHL